MHAWTAVLTPGATIPSSLMLTLLKPKLDKSVVNLEISQKVRDSRPRVPIHFLHYIAWSRASVNLDRRNTTDDNRQCGANVMT